MSPPELVFGGGGLTEAWREDNILELIQGLQEAKINRVDSAAVYPYTAPGGADRLLGTSKFPEKGFAIDTKALFFGDGSGTMTAEAIHKSLSGSLSALNIKKIDVFYCHAPDKKTPVAEQAAAMNAEYQKGSFRQLGVSNISVDMLEEWLQIADKEGFIKPTVYQGQYNLLCRTYEAKLFPFLRKHRISFVAFSPLAGGFLTGKLTFAKEPGDLVGTRFEVSDTNFGGMRYRAFYDKPAMHAALRKAKDVCTTHNITLAGAAFRWLLYHSQLSSGNNDRVIIGPSVMSQLESYVKAKNDGPLSEDIAMKLGALWNDEVREVAVSIVEY